MGPILILGGYGNFGWRIARAFAKAGMSFVISGRNEAKALSLSERLTAAYPDCSIEIAIFDIKTDLAAQLARIKPSVVINTCGPFQGTDYEVAEMCISVGVHYLDLADGRDFVRDIVQLDARAKSAGVLAVSGASTVPGLSSAVLEKFAHEFSQIERVVFGIAPGQKAPRGLATTQAILSYVGKPLKPFAGAEKAVFGWQNLYRQKYPVLGARWMANCDIPDLDLLPERYGIKSIQFSAGMENPLLHFGIWAVSWLVRWGLPLNLPRFAKPLLRVSMLFDWMGTQDGGMHMIMSGKDHQGQAYQRQWFIVACDNDGPNIPTIPVIILAKKLVRQEMSMVGAYPCVGLVSLEDYMDELKDFNTDQYSDGTAAGPSGK